jgi:hypothetical protein
MAASSIMLVTTSLRLSALCGAKSMMLEIRILYHACKLASVSDTQAFDSEDELLSYYFSLNENWPPSCAVVFEDLSPDGDVHDLKDLKYKIRISYTQFSTASLFPLFSSGVGYQGKTDNICNNPSYSSMWLKPFDIVSKYFHYLQ